MLIFMITAYFLVRNFIEYKESNDANKRLIENVIAQDNNDEIEEIVNSQKYDDVIYTK